MSAIANAVIEDLALSEAQLLERLRVVTAERDAYSDAWHIAVHAHHELTVEIESLRIQNAHLRDQLRARHEGQAA